MFLCPTSSIPKDDLILHLWQRVPRLFADQIVEAFAAEFKPQLKLWTTRVPLNAPTSLEVAEEVSNRIWPILYNHNTAYGPNPADVAAAQDQLSDNVAEYMSLARQAGFETSNMGHGVNAGAVIVERYLVENMERQRVVCVAGDARHARQIPKLQQTAFPISLEVHDGIGNPASHAAMRAISMVAAKRRCLAAANGEKTTNLIADSFNALPHVDAVFSERPLTEVELQYSSMSESLSTGGYLCLDLEIYLSHEPCLMCSMALNHSRFGKVVFGQRMPKTGGICADQEDGKTGTLGHGLFWREELNWRMLAWQWKCDNEKFLIGKDNGTSMHI